MLWTVVVLCRWLAAAAASQVLLWWQGYSWPASPCMRCCTLHTTLGSSSRYATHLSYASTAPILPHNTNQASMRLCVAFDDARLHLHGASAWLAHV